jgi:hypothetical protein
MNGLGPLARAGTRASPPRAVGGLDLGRERAHAKARAQVLCPPSWLGQLLAWPMSCWLAETQFRRLNPHAAFPSPYPPPTHPPTPPTHPRPPSLPRTHPPTHTKVLWNIGFALAFVTMTRGVLYVTNTPPDRVLTRLVEMPK